MIDGANAFVLASGAFAIAAAGRRLQRRLAPPRPLTDLADLADPSESLTMGGRRGPAKRGSESRVHRRATRVAAAALAISVSIWLLGPIVAAAGGLGIWGWRAARPVLSARHRRREIEEAIPDAVELVVLLVRAGLTPHQAVRAMRGHAPPPVRHAFDAVGGRLDRGTPLAEALSELVEHLGPDIAGVADTLAFSVRHGTPIGATLEQLSADVRVRRQRLARADAQRLPVRLSFPLVFCTLPSFVLVAIAPAVLAALSSISDTPW